MSTLTHMKLAPKVEAERIPPLQNGDRLTAEEFERRYDAMPELKKAELINGVVYMPPPITMEDHGGPHFDMICWLRLYRMATPGTRSPHHPTPRPPPPTHPHPPPSLH